MKKSILSIIIAVMAIGAGYAQDLSDVIAQPTHVVGKRINIDGEVTKEYVLDFTYLVDGKLSCFDFPEYAITANYIYSGDFLTQERITHSGGHPMFHETNTYTYDNGQIQSITHQMDQMGFSKYWLYSYYDDGRLERKDLKEEDDDDFHMHWLYNYENAGKTVIESYYTSWVSQGMLLRKKTTSQYDDSFVLFSTNTENFNELGELTSSTQTSYNYTPSGLLEMKMTQTLIEGEWYNSSITRYSYDELDQITEQIDGIWNTENSEWDFTQRIIFETSEQNQTYTVSFYKKNNNEWVWDIFNNQTVLFGDELKAQQRALSYLVYEDMNGYGNVNQFVFTLEEMNRPVYLFAEEVSEFSIDIYPNPSSGFVTITGENLQQAEVFNMLGRKLLGVKGKGSELHVNMTALPTGIYFVTVTNEEGRKCVRKVVKE